MFGGVFAVALLRLTVGGYLLARHWPWLLFCGATMVSFAMGSQLYGLKPVGVEYRSVFYVVAGCLYSASFRVDSEAGWPIGAALALVRRSAGGAGAWFRWAAEFLQLGVRSQWAGVGGDNPMRVLNAGQAFFLPQAFVTTIYLLRHVTARVALFCYSGLLLVTVILLQHRSVWVVTAACCLILAWRERALRKLLWGVALALVLGAPSVFSGEPVCGHGGRVVTVQCGEPFDSRRSTIAWRAVLWEQHFVGICGFERCADLVWDRVRQSDDLFSGRWSRFPRGPQLLCICAEPDGRFRADLPRAGLWAVASPVARVARELGLPGFVRHDDRGAVGLLSGLFAVVRTGADFGYGAGTGRSPGPGEARGMRPRVMWVHNFATHYTAGLFEQICQRLPVEFLFYSKGREWYWLQQNRLPECTFPHRHLWGMTIGGTADCARTPVAAVVGQL